jgi:ribosomal-protein-alanine N-acetyltransferase
LTVEDAPALHEVWSEPANERFIGMQPPTSVEETRGWIARGVPWGVWERAGGELVGDCGLFENGDGDWELAYGLRHDRWGRGYATEAARACVRHGFDVLGLERIVADVPVGHAASIRVLEKCGFELVGEQDGKLLYAVAPR